MRISESARVKTAKTAPAHRAELPATIRPAGWPSIGPARLLVCDLSRETLEKVGERVV